MVFVVSSVSISRGYHRFDVGYRHCPSWIHRHRYQRGVSISTSSFDSGYHRHRRHGIIVIVSCNNVFSLLLLRLASSPQIQRDIYLLVARCGCHQDIIRFEYRGSNIVYGSDGVSSVWFRFEWYSVSAIDEFGLRPVRFVRTRFDSVSVSSSFVVVFGRFTVSNLHGSLFRASFTSTRTSSLRHLSIASAYASDFESGRHQL